MIISSIDIGTNTVLLLIAEINPKNNKIIPLLNEYRIPRIGKNVGSTGEISIESIEKLKNILLEYKVISASYSCNKIVAVATAAFRKAQNSSRILGYIINETGINIEIISGDDEARFAFLGVSDGKLDDKTRLIIDIGGGSTEVITGRNSNVLFKKSFSIGVVGAAESDKGPSELRQFLQYVFQQFQAESLQFDEAYAVAGTPTTIAAIKHQFNYFNESIEDSILSLDDLREFIDNYSSNPDYYLNEYSSILKGREDLIVPGAVILEIVMKSLGINNIKVSTRGIRHGAIYNYLLSQG